MKYYPEQYIGKKFGRLTITEFNEVTKDYQKVVTAKCDCGVVKKYKIHSIVRGRSLSCGCYNREINSLRGKYGAAAKHRLYSVWKGIINRCYNCKAKQYNDYGGRGVIMCSDWRNNYLLFYEWAIKNGYAQRLQIDRIENSEGYSPTNCRFVTASKNCRNKRNNIPITINGITKVLIDWCEEFGVNHNTVRHRLALGWPIQKLFGQPKEYIVQAWNGDSMLGEYETFAQAAHEYNIRQQTVKFSALNNRPIAKGVGKGLLFKTAA